MTVRNEREREDNKKREKKTENMWEGRETTRG